MNTTKSRIKLKNYKKKVKLKDKVILISMLVLFLTISFLIYFNNRVTDVLTDYVEEKLKDKTVQTANQIIGNSFRAGDYNYEEFTTTSKNSQGEILFIDFDTIKVNKLLIEITQNVISELNSSKSEFLLKSSEIYYVPFGVSTNLTTLNWIGPQIPVRVITATSTESKVNTELKPYGINNALLEISIIMNVKIRILMPFTDRIINVEVAVPIVKKVIQGTIPQVYGGLYSNSSKVYTESLEK